MQVCLQSQYPRGAKHRKNKFNQSIDCFLLTCAVGNPLHNGSYRLYPLTGYLSKFDRENDDHPMDLGVDYPSWLHHDKEPPRTPHSCDGLNEFKHGKSKTASRQEEPPWKELGSAWSCLIQMLTVSLSLRILWIILALRVVEGESDECRTFRSNVPILILLVDVNVRFSSKASNLGLQHFDPTKERLHSMLHYYLSFLCHTMLHSVTLCIIMLRNIT